MALLMDLALPMVQALDNEPQKQTFKKSVDKCKVICYIIYIKNKKRNARWAFK